MAEVRSQRILKGLKGCRYKNGGVQNLIMESLDHQRKTKIFCDVVLHVCGEDIFAHSNILSAASPYFRSFLGVGQDMPRAFSQKSPQVIEIHIEGGAWSEGYAEAVKRIVDYMYTGEITVTTDVMTPLLEISKITEIKDVVDVCEKYKDGNFPCDDVNNDFVQIAHMNEKEGEVKNSVTLLENYSGEQAEANKFDNLEKNSIFTKYKNLENFHVEPGYVVVKLKDYVTISTQTTEIFSNHTDELQNTCSKSELTKHLSDEESNFEAQEDYVKDASEKVMDNPLFESLGLESKEQVKNRGKSQLATRDHNYDINDGSHFSKESSKIAAKKVKSSNIEKKTIKPIKKCVPDKNSGNEKDLNQENSDDKKDIPKKKNLHRESKQSVTDFTEPLPAKRRRKPCKRYANEDFVSFSKDEIKSEPLDEDADMFFKKVESDLHSVHDIHVNLHEDGKDEPRTKNTESESRLFTCPVCPYTTTSTYQYERHKVAHSKVNKLYTCDSCEYSSPSLKLLAGHRKKHIHDLNICSLCDMKLGSPEELEEHLKKHRGALKFFCTSCDSRFKTKTQLKFHLPVHSDLKPFGCSMCRMRFKWKHALKSHMITHSKVKNLLCDICGFATAHQSLLKAHKLIHTGEMFNCSVPGCQFVTNKRQNLKYHMLTHTKEKPHQCEKCGQSFSLLKNMKRHMLMHTNERPYKCEKCEFASTRYDRLRDHKKKSHNISLVTRKKVRIVDYVQQGSLTPAEDSDNLIPQDGTSLVEEDKEMDPSSSAAAASAATCNLLLGQANVLSQLVGVDNSMTLQVVSKEEQVYLTNEDGDSVPIAVHIYEDKSGTLSMSDMDYENVQLVAQDLTSQE